MNIMANENDNSVIGPDEGELVVCTVTEVKQNGAYVSINGYDDINGFIFYKKIYKLSFNVARAKDQVNITI